MRGNHSSTTTWKQLYGPIIGLKWWATDNTPPQRRFPSSQTINSLPYNNQSTQDLWPQSIGALTEKAMVGSRRDRCVTLVNHLRLLGCLAAWINATTVVVPLLERLVSLLKGPRWWDLGVDTEQITHTSRSLLSLAAQEKRPHNNLSSTVLRHGTADCIPYACALQILRDWLYLYARPVQHTRVMQHTHNGVVEEPERDFMVTRWRGRYGEVPLPRRRVAPSMGIILQKEASAQMADVRDCLRQLLVASSTCIT